MKASSFLRPLPSSSSSSSSSSLLISSLFHKFCSFKSPTNSKRIAVHSHLCTSAKPFSSLSPLSSQIPHKPKTPLFLKPPIYSATQSDINTFITWAKTLISSVGSTFVDLDNGPDHTLLHRELKWFLDDAVEDPSLVGGATTVALGLTQAKAVNLRESLDEMYKLWEERMVKRRPFQYIVGCEHWRDLVLSVEDGVLIPRPETAAIVDVVEGLVKEVQGLKKGGVWADLGTGSGALAIGIARALGGEARVVASDISPIAVAVAKYNAERYDLQDIIDVRQGSWFDPVMEFEGQLVGLVSNPPYIPSEDISGLQAEVGKHEPWLALDGGPDGLEYLSYLCTKTSTMLKPGGFFAFETNGEKQCNILADYLENTTEGSICNVNTVSDFAGVPRFVTGRRRE